MDTETHIDVRSHNNGKTTLVVMVVGELDMANAPEFESKLLRAVEAGGGSVLVDLSECDFIDSTTLKVLVKAHTASDGRISLLAPHAHVRRVLEISQLDHVLHVYADRTAAMDGHASV